MGTISGLWRWRRNPLCRATDLAEARLALITLLLVVLLAPLTGVLVGGAAEQDLRRMMRDQHRTRHPVRAFVVRRLEGPLRDTDPEKSTGGDTRSRVLARWTAPDGTRHRGTVLAHLPDPHPGERFTLWTDRRGRTVARPLDSATATTHAALAGLGAALMAVALVEGGRRLLLWQMVRRRYARWDQAWDGAGPDWGRTGAGGCRPSASGQPTACAHATVDRPNRSAHPAYDEVGAQQRHGTGHGPGDAHRHIAVAAPHG